MAYRAVKYYQLEAGVFTKSNNMCNVHINTGGVSDLSESYVLFHVYVSHPDGGIFNGILNLAKDSSLRMEGGAMVRHFTLSSSTRGQLEENKYINVLRTSMQNLELTQEEQQSLEPNGFGRCRMDNDRTVLKFPLSRLSELAKTQRYYEHQSNEQLTLNFVFEDTYDFFSEVVTPTTLGALTWNIEKVEVVMFQTLGKAKGASSKLNYLTWNVEMSNMQDTDDYRRTYELDANTQSVVLVSQMPDQVFGYDGSMGSYRTALNNIDTTDRDVDFGDALYFDRLLTNVDNVKSLHTDLSDDFEVNPIVEKTPGGGLFSVQIKAGENTMGTRMNYLFKRVAKAS